jgi:hypothetical protein
MKKEIRNYNKAGKFHGYQELYDLNLILSFRGNSKNGYGIGYSESHYLTGSNYYYVIR